MRRTILDRWPYRRHPKPPLFFRVGHILGWFPRHVQSFDPPNIQTPSILKQYLVAKADGAEIAQRVVDECHDVLRQSDWAPLMIRLGFGRGKDIGVARSMLCNKLLPLHTELEGENDTDPILGFVSDLSGLLIRPLVELISKRLARDRSDASSAQSLDKCFIFLRFWIGFTDLFPFDEFNALRAPELEAALDQYALRWVRENRTAARLWYKTENTRAKKRKLSERLKVEDAPDLEDETELQLDMLLAKDFDNAEPLRAEAEGLLRKSPITALPTSHSPDLLERVIAQLREEEAEEEQRRGTDADPPAGEEGTETAGGDVVQPERWLAATQATNMVNVWLGLAPEKFTYSAFWRYRFNKSYPDEIRTRTPIKKDGSRKSRREVELHSLIQCISNHFAEIDADARKIKDYGGDLSERQKRFRDKARADLQQRYPMPDDSD